jgi:hypothetical protein
MMLPFRRLRFESWVAIRQRMIRETEAFLEEGLRRPEQQRRIPALPVGSGSFTRGYASVFWAEVLGSS